MGVMIMCPREFYVAVCSIKVEKAALSLSLVGQP